MAKALLRTFPCGNGDCIFLLLKEDNGAEFHMMVDCGIYNNEISDFVENKFHKHIDLLIATHIDNDHISGLAKMLDSTPDLSIGKIIYNCYQQPKEKEIGIDSAIETLSKEYIQDLPPSIEYGEYQASAREAILLAKSIVGRDEWKNVWNTDYVTNQSPDLVLQSEMGDSFGKLVFLSPTNDALEKLDNSYKRAFFKFFFKSKSENYIDESNIFELLTLFEQLEKGEVCDTEQVSDSNVTKQYLDSITKSEKSDSSLTNISSLAFIWEYKDSRILFLGDAVPEVIVNAIRDKYTGSIPLHLLAVKVSHHGSLYNTSFELLNLLQTNHFIFTGGNSNDKPSEQTIAKIIKNNSDDNQMSYLHFNHKNSNTERFVNTPSLTKNILHFEADYEENYAFEF